MGKTITKTKKVAKQSGKALFNWLKTQEEVRWPTGSGLIVYLKYSGVECVGVITKSYTKGRLLSSISIRPKNGSHDIGHGAGQAVIKEFGEL